MNDDLKLCPFCGGEAYIKKQLTHVAVKCEDCYGNMTCVVTSRRPDMDYFTYEAITAWNRRPDEKYKKLLAFVNMIYNRRLISPVTIDSWNNNIERARELLKEIEPDGKDE